MSDVYSFDFTIGNNFFSGLNKAFVSAGGSTSPSGFPTRSYWCQDGNLHIDMEYIHRLNVVLKYKFNKHTNKELYIDDIQDSVVIFKAVDGTQFNDLVEVVEPGSLTESSLKWIKVYEDNDDMVVKPPLQDSTVHFYIRKTRTTVHMKSNERYILKAPNSQFTNKNFFQIFPLQNYDSTKPVIENFNLFKVGSDVFDAAYTLLYTEQNSASEEFKVSITNRSIWIFGSKYAVSFGVCKTALRNDAPYIYHPIGQSLDQSYLSLLDDRFLIEFDGSMIDGQPLRFNGYRDMSYAINTIVGLIEDARIVPHNLSYTERVFHFPIAELETKTVVGTRNGQYRDLTIIDNQKHLFIGKASSFAYNICVRI